MPEFLIFAVAVSMCILCFAGGFVAALALRIAGQNAIPSRGASDASERPTPAQPEIRQPTLVEAPPAPADYGQVFRVPQPPTMSEHEPAAVTRPEPPLPMRPATRAVRTGGFPTAFPAPAPSAQPAKMFLFGDPHVEAVAVPSFAPAHAASHASPLAPKPHVAPLRLAPGEIDLMPRRPPHARSDRAR